MHCKSSVATNWYRITVVTILVMAWLLGTGAALSFGQGVYNPGVAATLPSSIYGRARLQDSDATANLTALGFTRSGAMIGWGGPIQIAETAPRAFTWSTRSALATFPVPGFRPVQAGTVIAVDIMPNGAAAENAGNGFAWLDVCGEDCLTGSPPVTAARVGNTSDGVVFGSMAFNGATVKPLLWRIGTTTYAELATDGTVSIVPSANRAFNLTARTDVATYPVISLRPKAADKTVSLELMPNGAAVESAGNGYAWFDVADTDVLSGGAVSTARVGMRSDAAEFGSRAFLGAACKPMVLSYDGADIARVDANGVLPASDGVRRLGSAKRAWTDVVLHDAVTGQRWKVELSAGVLRAVETTSGEIRTGNMFGSLVVGSSEPTAEAWWKLNETAGTTAADSAGSGFDLTLQSDASTRTVAGVIGTALHFDGATDQAKRNAATVTDSAGSIVAWVRPTSTAAAAAILASCDEASTTRYFSVFMQAGGYLGYSQRNNDTYDACTGNTVMPVNEWAHVAVTSDGSTIKGYVNGVVQTLTWTSGANNGDWFGDTADRDNLTLAARQRTTVDQRFTGDMDDVRVYASELTPAQIAYYAAKPGETYAGTITFNGLSVTVGAPDSGGTGYRALVVPN